jgi:GrpB-like predicted nucleotidyltransferase (UPF0157 family)
MIKLINEIDIRADAQRIYNILRERCSGLVPNSEIEHIGSTSIPGALTKGDLDVLVMVSTSEFSAAREILDQEFERNHEMDPEPEFVSYSGTLDGLDFGVQLIPKGETKFGFIELRETLRESQELLSKYNDIKRGKKDASMEEYRAAKSSFILSILGI